MLFDIDCTDSLVFFREMHRLLNDKDILENNPSEPVNTTNEIHNPSESVDTTNKTDCADNNNNINKSIDSTTRLGYVEIPIKYIPSIDPARQQLSMKLIKIYEREFAHKSTHLKSHRAEDDCLMLLALIKRYLPDWLEWIEINHQKLNNFMSLPLVTVKKTLPKPVINRKRPLKF